MENERDDKRFPVTLNISPSSHLGDVSANVLLDRFQPVEFVHIPKRSVKRFRWFATISGDNAPDFGFQRDILFFCHNAIAERLLRDNPTCACLVYVTKDDDLSWITQGHFQSRVFAFTGEHRFYYYDAILHNIFINDLIWENEMDRIVYSRGRLEKLVEASEGALKNFVCVIDSGFNLNACSSTVAPECEGLRYLAQNNSMPRSEIDFLKKQIIPKSTRKHQIIMADADENHPYPVLHMPLFIDGEYVFHVCMECAHGSIESLRDLFNKFTKRVVSLCTEFWRNTVVMDAPWHRVLVSLLDGAVSSSDYLETQLSLTAIPRASQFRVVYLRFDPLISNQDRMKILNNTGKLNGGLCYPFIYKDDIVALVYSLAKNDAALSAANMNDAVNEFITKPFGLTMSCSEVFYRIEDLHNAYRQACIAFDLRGVLAREMELVSGATEMPVSPFDHCLKYYLLMGDADQDLIKYSFKSSILKRLVDEDAESGTEIAHLLWVYLSCDKNATETAKRVHVHRNTVLYHIDRLEKRFGLDFSSPFLRNRIVLDYQQLMLEGLL